jgi:hypothetical protein
MQLARLKDNREKALHQTPPYEEGSQPLSMSWHIWQSCGQHIWISNKGNYEKPDTENMAASPGPTRRSSWEMPTMQLETLDAIKEEEMNEHEKRDNKKEDQYSEDFDAMNRG